MTLEEIVAEFETIQYSLKRIHWMTNTEPKHRAFDEAHSGWSDGLDTLAEATISINGRTKLPILGEEYTEKNIISAMVSATDNLKKVSDDKGYNDLSNLADEMKAVCTKLAYKLQFG